MNPLTDTTIGPEAAKAVFPPKPEWPSNREYPRLTDEQAASVAARYPTRMKAESNVFAIAAAEYPGVIEEVGVLLSGKTDGGESTSLGATPDTSPALAQQVAQPNWSSRGAEAFAKPAMAAPELTQILTGMPPAQPDMNTQWSQPAQPPSETQAVMAAQARGMIDQIHGSHGASQPFSLEEMERAA